MAQSTLLHNTIRNDLRAITTTCTLPQTRAVKDVLLSVMKEGTTIVQHLNVRSHIRTGKQAERLRRHLEIVDLSERVEKRIMKILPKIEDDTVICYDLSDIAKPAAKKMEGLSRVFDGSERKSSNGYTIHGVSIFNQPIVMELHDAERDTLNQTRLDIVDRIMKKGGRKGIWVWDRGNDDQKLFSDLSERELRFVVRLTTKRKVIHKKSGMRIGIADFLPGIYQIIIPATQEECTLVVHKHHEKLQPIRVLTNVAVTDAKEIIETYLVRWDVENLFKQMKRKFDLEAIRLLSLAKIKNMLALIQLATSISNRAYAATTAKQTNELTHAFKKYCYHHCLYENRFSFTSFISTVIPVIPLPPRISSPQLSLLSWREVGKLGVF
jgi:hypothetical protein